MDESLKWTESKIKQSSHRKGYWHHVSLFMTQLTGIAEGYHHVMKGIMFMTQLTGIAEGYHHVIKVIIID